MELSRRGVLITNRMEELRLGPLVRLGRRARIRPLRLRALLTVNDPYELELARLAVVLRLEIAELVQP
jgi:hypothetical protein